MESEEWRVESGKWRMKREERREGVNSEGENEGRGVEVMLQTKIK